MGRHDLISSIEWSSEILGDGCGYDIKSFDENENELYIEVKTTEGDFNNRFLITKNELKFAEANQDKYMLYRVYKSNKEFKVKILSYSDLMGMSLNPCVFTVTPSKEVR